MISSDVPVLVNMGTIPEPNKPIKVVINKVDGHELGQLGFDNPQEPIAALVAQTMMMRGSGTPQAFVYRNPSDAEFFTIESWDPRARILTVKLKK